MAFGPIDIIALEFKGSHLYSEILSELTELVSNEIVRILDLVIIQKDEQGEITIRELQELDPETMQMFEPLRAEISGLITIDDITMIAEKLERGRTTAVMLFESLWLVRLAQDILYSGGRLIVQDRIPSEVIAQAIEDLSFIERYE